MSEPATRPYHHGDLRKAALGVAVAHLRGGADQLPTVREIATELGVTHRALYRHFADKEALRAAVAGEGFALLTEAMQAEVPASARTVMQAYLRFALAEPGLYRLMFSLGSSELMRDPAPGREVRRLIAFTATVFGGDDAAITRDRVVSAWGMAHGLIELWRAGALRASDSDRAATYILSRLTASGLI